MQGAGGAGHCLTMNTCATILIGRRGDREGERGAESRPRAQGIWVLRGSLGKHARFCWQKVDGSDLKPSFSFHKADTGPGQVVSPFLFSLSFESSLKLLILVHREMPDGSGPCLLWRNAPSKSCQSSLPRKNLADCLLGRAQLSVCAHAHRHTHHVDILLFC